LSSAKLRRRSGSEFVRLRSAVSWVWRAESSSVSLLSVCPQRRPRAPPPPFLHRPQVKLRNRTVRYGVCGCGTLLEPRTERRIGLRRRCRPRHLPRSASNIHLGGRVDLGERYGVCGQQQAVTRRGWQDGVRRCMSDCLAVD